MDQVPARSASELAADIAKRRLSAAEATEQAIERIEKLDGQINAIVVRDFDRARNEAHRADIALARGERKPFLGVPITIKESFDVAGLPTSWGMPWAANIRAANNAAAVERLKSAGAIILGKSNVHFQLGLFHDVEVPLPLHDWQSFNPVYGTTNNPWDTGRTPGGSSGGAAAALAARLVALELGSDVGGSIRAPAHFCGVYGHKSTSGLVSALGHAPPGAEGPPPPFPLLDMACFGPMARSAYDLGSALSVLAEAPLDAPRHQRLSDHRVIVLDDHPLMPVASDIRALIQRLADQLERKGVTVAKDSDLLPDLANNARAYMQALSAFDRLLGWSPAMIAALKQAAHGIDANDHSLGASRLRGALLSPSEINALARSREAIRISWRRLFEVFDVLLCPVMPTAAFAHDQSADQETRKIVVDGTAYPYMDQLFWPGVATFAGLPATACPLGLSDDGLPVGLQVIGRFGGDLTTVAFASLMEREFGGAPELPLRSP